MQDRHPSLIDPPIGFAHRGARAHSPENTLEAFQVALRLGATGLESDVWVTADGVAVLDHDGELRVGGRKRAIRRLRREELPPHIPTLAELLALSGPAIEISLDVKDPSAGPEVLATARAAHPDAEQRLWLCVPGLDQARAMRALSAAARVVVSTRLSRLAGGPERAAAALRAEGVDALNLPHTEWTGGHVALAHRFGLFAFAWDLQYERTLRRAIRMGVDAVYSDWVDRMVDAIALEAPRGS